MITVSTGSSLAAGLASLSAGMAGDPLSDLYDEHMTGTYDPVSGDPIGFGNFTSNEPAISGNTSSSIIDSSESDPVDAFEEYQDDGGDVNSITGGAISGSDVETFNYSLLEDPEGNVSAVAPVAVPIDHAYVAIAQALGVSMKVSEIDPVLGNRMTLAILASGAVYDKTRNLALAWWDGVNILFPRKTVQAIEDLFDEIGIGADPGEVIPPSGYDFDTIDTYGNVITFFEYHTDRSGRQRSQIQVSAGDGVYFFVKSSNGTINAISLSPSTLMLRSRTQKANGTYLDWSSWVAYNLDESVNTLLDGSHYYHRQAALGSNIYEEHSELPNPFVKVSGKDQDLYGRQVDTAILLGTISQGGYPEGTAESQATKYNTASIPSAGGVAKSPTEKEPVVPINLPVNPLDTTGSTVDPISQSDDDTVSDLPAPPIPVPVPDTNVSNPDVPLVDSSVVDSVLINELVEELANTLDPQPPQSSGLIPVPLLPGIPDGQGGSSYPSIVPASGSGLVHVYNPTPGEMVSFGNWLWVTYADASIDKIWNNPFDGIIGAHELYATPSTDGTDNIRSGFLVCPTTAALVRQRYTEIDCGSIIVPEFYGNYLDYSPYSQAYVYLPFIGIQEVSIDDIVGHAVNIRYRVDAYNGSCIAMIYVAKSDYRNLCYQFAGNCAVEVPLAGGSQAAIKAGMMQAEAYATAGVQSSVLAGIGQALSGLAAGFAFGGAKGAVGGLATGALGGLANYGAAKINAGATRDAALVANKSSVQHSGTFGASHGAMGLKIPFIMIRNPIQVKVVNYNKDYGFPAHKRVIIGGCHGYLRVKEVNVISATATNEEKMAIEEALKAGVYVD